MNIKEFDYLLPDELIAQTPAHERSAARMMVVERSRRTIRHHIFRDLPQLLSPGDLIVFNNTKVFPARLIGRLSGRAGAVELLLIRRCTHDVWETLARPGRKIKKETELRFEDGVSGRVVEVGPRGRRLIRFECAGNFFDHLERIGQTPLPPYIRRAGPPEEEDRRRYQTVYARTPGSVAAPTAGLHFTPAILQALKERNIDICEITLHVGYGTFQPVRTESVEEHRMEPETYVITPEAADIINTQKAAGGRVIAVGTTTTRTLEAVASRHDGRIVAGMGETALFITPGFPFRILSGLITNFHLPRSTLLMLVCAFAGKDFTLEWYRQAVRERYRFYSYGDCALIL